MFLGTIGENFDFSFLDLVAANNNIWIDLFGDGDLLGELKVRYKDQNNIYFGGFKNLSDVKSNLENYNCAIAPYQNLHNFQKNVPNKIIDYFGMGLPVLVPSYCLAIKNMFKGKKCILSYENNHDLIRVMNMIDHDYLSKASAEIEVEMKSKFSHFRLTDDIESLIKRI